MPYTITTIDSDKDTHFSGSIAQDAIENESIDFPSDFSTTQIQKLLIRQVTLQADQALNWDLMIWSDSGYADSSDMDSDAHITTISLLASNAVDIAGTNQSYYDYEPSSPILYTDKNNTSKLHVGLVNRSATSKNAGATGEVKVRFMAEPIL